ncbi:hypothetical protein Hanom_Chr16g01438661 [Helianthus anomalus]
MVLSDGSKRLIPPLLHQKYMRKLYIYRWISGIIFGNVPLNLTNKISTNISGFRINTTTNSTKKRHRRSTEPITRYRFKKPFPIITIINLKNINCNIQHKKIISSQQKSHNSSRTKRNNKRLSDTFSCLKGSSSICVCGNFHPEKTGYNGSYGPEDE